MGLTINTTDEVDFGDVSADAGLTAITVAITCNISSSANNERFCSHWGNSSSEQAWVMGARTTNNVLFGVHGSGNSRIFRTNTNDVTGLSRIVGAWDTSGALLEIWVNGVSKSLTSENLDSVTSLGNSTTTVEVGSESDETLDAVDGNYSEFAMWNHNIPNWVKIAYGKGMSPAYYRNGGLLYSRLANTGFLRDEWGGVNPTSSGVANAAHPITFYPRRRLWSGPFGVRVAFYKPARLESSSTIRPRREDVDNTLRPRSESSRTLRPRPDDQVE